VIVVNYTEDYVQGTIDALKASNLAQLLERGAKRARQTVSVKPNMVCSRPPSEGATTHPEIVEGIVLFIKSLNMNIDIEIIESAWIGDDTKRVYRVCGFDELSRKYGVVLHDLKDDKIRKIKIDKYNFEICEKALNTDFLINVPVLKAHCQTTMTCNLKNLKGCISDREKRQFHSMGLHRPIAWLNKAIKTHFCVVDGICGDLTFEEGGNPVTRNMILCGQDPLTVDSYCANLIGLDPREVEHLSVAESIGVGRFYNGEPVIELNSAKKPKTVKLNGGTAASLSKYINERSACSACYSALINAIYRADYRGEKIAVGQGFAGRSDPGTPFGCGDCCRKFAEFVPGCPPKAIDVVKFLQNL
jgi:uncharacterized protein (DUF362 family)